MLNIKVTRPDAALMLAIVLSLLSACGGGSGGGSAAATSTPTSTTTAVGAAGGTVKSYYGAQLDVPAGALAGSVDIGFKRDSSSAPEFALPDVEAAGATYELTPHGTTFTAPVTLRIPFDPALVPPDSIPTLYKAEQGGTFAAIPTTVDGNMLVATVSDFSWVIPGYAASKPRAVYALQAPGQSNPVSLASYSINSATGALTGPTSTALTGEAPTSVVAHPSRRFAYVTHEGSTTVNNIAPNSVAVYRLDATNGKIVGAATSSVSTGAATGYKPTMPVIHPSGKFLYVMNFGSVSLNNGGDISLFRINGTTGGLTLSANAISGGGAQPMGIAFNPLGTFAYVLYAGTDPGNTFSSQVKVYSVNATTGALTGPLSGVAACGLGNHPWSITVDAYGAYAYVACLSGDEIITYSINGTSGALTNNGSTTITAGSKLTSLAADSFGRFIYAGRQQPWYSTNLLSYSASATTGALSAANSVLTACPGGGCVGPMAVVADPQGQFVYAADVQQGLSAFSVNSSNGNLTSAGAFSGKVYVPWTGGIGMPFTFGITGTSPLWQNNCTQGCAMSFPDRSGSGSGSGATNPSPPTSYILRVPQGDPAGYVTSSPAGINIEVATTSNPLPANNFEAEFPANSVVQLCTSPPPQPAQGYDVTWSVSCSGTGRCTNVLMNGDKECRVEFTPVSTR